MRALIRLKMAKPRGRWKRQHCRRYAVTPQYAQCPIERFEVCSLSLNRVVFRKLKKSRFTFSLKKFKNLKTNNACTYSSKNGETKRKMEETLQTICCVATRWCTMSHWEVWGMFIISQSCRTTLDDSDIAYSWNGSLRSSNSRHRISYVIQIVKRWVNASCCVWRTRNVWIFGNISVYRTQKHEDTLCCCKK